MSHEEEVSLMRNHLHRGSAVRLTSPAHYISDENRSGWAGEVLIVLIGCFQEGKDTV